MTPGRRILIMAAVATLAAVSTAHAQTPMPTLAFDQPCYSPGDRMDFSGSGYTPNGAVALFFAANGEFGTYETTAAPDGAIGGSLQTPDPDDFLDDDQTAAVVSVTANDQTRIEAQEPPETQFGVTEFRLSRWTVAYRSAGGRIAPKRRVTFRAVGFTHAIGDALYVHYRRGGRTVASKRLGVLSGDCGDLTKRLPRAFPFRNVKPGAYKLYFNNSRSRATATPSIAMPVRVRARDVR